MHGRDTLHRQYLLFRGDHSVVNWLPLALLLRQLFPAGHFHGIVLGGLMDFFEFWALGCDLVEAGVARGVVLELAGDIAALVGPAEAAVPVARDGLLLLDSISGNC